jgi:hypothetical protein
MEIVIPGATNIVLFLGARLGVAADAWSRCRQGRGSGISLDLDSRQGMP